MQDFSHIFIITKLLHCLCHMYMTLNFMFTYNVRVFILSFGTGPAISEWGCVDSWTEMHIFICFHSILDNSIKGDTDNVF